MAEVTGNPPVEYRHVGVENAPNPNTGWQTQPAAAPVAEPVESGSLARQLAAEFIGTFLFIFIAVSVAYWWHADFLSIGIANGVALAVLVFVFLKFGSGQFNPAITLGLLLGGKLKFKRAMLIVPTQFFAGVVACFLISTTIGNNQLPNWILPNPPDGINVQTATMLKPLAAATPTVPRRTKFVDGRSSDSELIVHGKDYPVSAFRQIDVKGSQRVSIAQAIMLESIFTFLWGLAVFAGIQRGQHVSQAVFVGGAVVVGILVCGTMTGAAMNPVRAFAPALVSGTWDFQLIYWIGPLLGGALAGVICGRFLFCDEDETDEAALAYPRT